MGARVKNAQFHQREFFQLKHIVSCPLAGIAYRRVFKEKFDPAPVCIIDLLDGDLDIDDWIRTSHSPDIK